MSSTKGKAKRFLHKLIDAFDSNNDQPESPPKPPPKLTEGNANSATKIYFPDPDLEESFNALALSGNPRYHTDPSFIGGFNPATTYGPPNQFHRSSVPSSSNLPPRPGYLVSHNSSPPPRPPAMPVPHRTDQSLTMQMALGLRPPRPPSFNPTRPHSTSVLSSTSEISSGTAPSSSAQLSSSTPSKPKRSRASSTPTTPSHHAIPGSRQQCSGVTKAGKRCTRQVKSSPTFVQAQYDDEDEDSPIEVFCFQHTKELLGPSGYYARNNGKWVKFEDWIPPYLQPDTQVALRIEMEKARSQSDVPGYIYTFEIRDPDATNTIKLKVGRAVNLVKRIDQWGKQCGSKEQVLRGWFPGTVELDDNSGPGSLMKGRMKAGEKGSWCHRMERLIHLELADLAATRVYLDAAWPNIETQPGISTSNSATTTTTTTKEPCEDCGSIHKEIFEFEKLGGRYNGKEWDSIVQPVVQRWGTFVKLYV